jgi:methylenetetrahydrofolate dehydrogenase (NADP+) / methenyltetrahydrofolate cyclohydrolase
MIDEAGAQRGPEDLRADARARILDGAAIAAKLRDEVRQQVGRLVRDHDVRPGLAVVLVGNDPAAGIYVRNKTKHAAGAGIVSRQIDFPATVPEYQLLGTIAGLNADPAIDGILVQMPLPSHIRTAAVTDAIDPAKDVDGFHPINAGHLLSGTEGLVPCTPLGCILLLRHALGTLVGLDALMLGRSIIVGKPMAILLLREHCTVTIAHSRTRDLPALCRRADILVAAIGKPRFVEGDWIKPGATVIDVGINRISENGKTGIAGDVDFDAALSVAGAITPVPGGVGPMTIACLLANTLTAACRRRGIALGWKPSL